MASCSCTSPANSGNNAYATTVEVWDLRKFVAGTDRLLTEALGRSHRVKYQLKREPGVEYQIKGAADGYDESTTPLVFTGDPTQEFSVSLVAKAGTTPPPKDPTPKVTKNKKKGGGAAKPKTAELKIGVAPGNPPATVYVDGRKAGRSPQFVKVSAGNHTVKWKWDDGKTDTQKVSIGDKESKLLKGSK